MATLAGRDRGGFALPDLWRRFFETSPESEGWLRAEERRDGDDFLILGGALLALAFRLRGIEHEIRSPHRVGPAAA